MFMKKLVLLTILILLITSKKLNVKSMFNPIRGNDDFGSGHFGASRGNRPHLGIDYVTTEGEPIYAPFDMEVTRVSLPYFDTSDYKGIAFSTQIAGVNYDGRWWYFVPNSDIIGHSVSKGQLLGYAQSLQGRYQGITDHTHLQLRSTTELQDSIYYNGWYYVNPEYVI